MSERGRRRPDPTMPVRASSMGPRPQPRPRRGEPDTGEFIAFWLHERRVLAWDLNEHVQALIRSRRTVEIAALGDPDTPLDSLVGEVTTEG